jgi:hypothetical protein
MTDQVHEAQVVPPPVQDKASGMAIAALVLGILGIPCCCGVFTALPAAVLGFIEYGRIGRGTSSPKGKGMAIAGIVLGILFAVLGCGQLVWYFFFGGMKIMQNLMQLH